MAGFLHNPRLTAGSLLVWLTATAALAHGVHADLLEGGTGVRARFDTGEPMAFADVKVFAPDAPNEAWLESTTDPEGRFVFVPPRPGVWRIAVDDGMGHALFRDIAVGADGHAHMDDDHHHHHHLHGLSAAIGGVGFILGLFGMWALFRQRPKKN